MEAAIIKPLELRRQAGPEAEHLSVEVTVEEVAQELIQDQTALDQASQHVAIGFERSEVAREACGDRFGSWISKALVGKEAAGEYACRKGNEQGLLDAAQIRQRRSGVGVDGQRGTRSLDGVGTRL